MDRQLYKFKKFSYSYTVNKTLLYFEVLIYREIERVLDVSPVNIINWVKKHNIKHSYSFEYQFTYNTK